MNTLAKASLRARLAVVGFTLATVAVGCATTQQVKVSDQSYCPFLGNGLCAKMTPADTPGALSEAAITGGSGTERVALRYINPNAQWTRYKKVMVAPVTFWAGDETKVSAADQQALTSYTYKALHDALAPKFQVVDQAGPDVMIVHVAIEDATTATPVLRTISMVVPQARGLATLKYIATGTYAFVGGAQGEAKVVDSTTGEVLAAGVDKRVGGGSIATAAQWQWGDAENAISAWAQLIANRLSLWKPAARRHERSQRQQQRREAHSNENAQSPGVDTVGLCPFCRTLAKGTSMKRRFQSNAVHLILAALVAALTLATLPAAAQTAGGPNPTSSSSWATTSASGTSAPTTAA